MQLSHTHPVASAIFDDPNLVSTAGLVPVIALAQHCNLAELADKHLSVPTDKGANAGRKIGSLVAGMVAGAGSIADSRWSSCGRTHGFATTRSDGHLFDRPYAPSTLGSFLRECSFLREFTFGHVRQPGAVASRFLCGLAEKAPIVDRVDGRVMIDIDDSIIEIHDHSKQGSGYGYSGVRGLNSLITTVTTIATAPVIVGQRLRRGSCGSSRGAARMVADTLTRAAAAISATPSSNGVESQPVSKPLLRADSAFLGYPTIGAAICGGADVSITTGLNSVIRSAISTIAADAPAPIECTHAVFDEQTQRWISVAEVAEIPFYRIHLAEESPPRPRAFDRPTHPLVFDRKRIRDNASCSTCGDSTRSSPPPPIRWNLTPLPPTRSIAGTEIVEQVHADLRNSALAHLPSAHFCANAAWLICAVMAFNLTRAAATLTGDPALVKASTGTIRRTVISVPARIASSARKLTLHLPIGGPWEEPWMMLFKSMFRDKTADHSVNALYSARRQHERPSGAARHEVG